MSVFLILAFLFSTGSFFGWCMEVIFRRFFSKANPMRKWINPGFLTGPYLPIYGFGLVTLFLLASTETIIPVSNQLVRKIIMFAIMAICMTLIEYIAGILMIKHAHVRLWDYSMCRGNIQGIICPAFSICWALLGAVYYFLIHPHILESLNWLANNLAFSFFIGLFYGIFIIDFVQRTQMMITLRRFALEHQMIIKYEDFREHIRSHNASAYIRVKFWMDMHSDTDIKHLLEEYYASRNKKLSEFKKKIDQLLP